VKEIKNNRGFTLVEVIIAIGIMAIASVVILQLFITAKNINQKANDLDKSILASTSIIELFKSGETPDDIKTDPYIEHAKIDESNDIININIYYDDNWNLLESKDGNLYFTLTAVITPISSIDLISNKTSKYYKIEVHVVKAKPYPLEKNFEKEIYSVETIRYFD
jgi:prepilin-type N-terminal cleavage/methylation domain-containing protein